MAKHHAAVEKLTKKAEQMYDCGNYLVFKIKDDRLKLYQTYFCKARLCPMCNWRRSLKIAFQNKKIIQAVNEREKVRWVVLTLTVRNVDGEDLKPTQLGNAEEDNLIHIDEDSDEVANGTLDVMANRHVGLNNYVIGPG
ncbi:protein rep [Sporosarcina sp. Te-1]|uniref:protein rep n=1 Tax=Sporosarcina sp. Te-1 TaxID=2818390 RepID=UPI001A9F4249|nr:protein rep [Sporosarcina sp. Te-1]QTD39770.1 protein rep [Sporosarcina sp. Te-1]